MHKNQLSDEEREIALKLAWSKMTDDQKLKYKQVRATPLQAAAELVAHPADEDPVEMTDKMVN